jgi:hypothetical protein
MRESAQPATVIAAAVSPIVMLTQRDERFKVIPPDRKTGPTVQHYCQGMAPARQTAVEQRRDGTARRDIMAERINGHRNGRGARRGCAGPLIFRHQPACKPGFVGHRLLAQTVRDGHSSGTMFAHCLEQPTRTASLTTPCGVIALRRTSRVAVPIRSCSRCGLPCRFRCRTRGALLPHLFTLTTPTPRREKASGSFSVALSLGSPPPDVIRHRLSMEPGLSSPATFR